MEFDLTPEQKQLYESAIRFARKDLQSGAIERDRSGTFWREGWQKCAEFGALGLPIPREFGGAEADMVSTIAVLEGLGYGCRDQGLLFSIAAHLWTNSIPILRYGTVAQKQKYLPGLCDGSLIGANATTEPDSGSDAFSLRTRAVRDGDTYVLNGTKTFVTNAEVANVVVVYATLDPEIGPMGICSFLVETDTPGLVIGRPIEKMGLRSSPMAEIVFEDCRIPAASLLGREGRGIEVFNYAMEYERGFILASTLGTMRRQLETCVEYAKSRKQFGQRIGSFQSVSHRLVSTRVGLDAARMLVYRAAWLRDQGKPFGTESAIAKLFVSESLVKAGLDSVCIHGGYGFTTDFEIEREFRDAVGSMLYSGTSDIQRNIIARSLGL